MSEFEEFARSQGFSGDFQRGCNGQYKSDLLHFMEKAFMHQQAKIDELQKKYDAMYNAFTVADDCRKEWHESYMSARKERDELQARVDEITNHVGINFDEERDDDQHSYWSGYNQAMRELNDILKGKEDEN